MTTTPTIHYSTDEALRDCDRPASLTSKLARVDHHIDFTKQCFDSNVIPTGLTWDISCNVIEKSQTDIESNWTTILKDASKSLMTLTLNHYCTLKTTLKNQIRDRPLPTFPTASIRERTLAATTTYTLEDADDNDASSQVAVNHAVA